MKVSVCLASYNGESYLAEQISSILADLGPDDELILSDDASTDGTVAVARRFSDKRLKIHSFTDNVRHVRNFERAIGLATGDLIFLSDQDDVWLKGKRAKLVELFARSPDVVMVVHALTLIDPQGRVITPRSNVWPSRLAGRQAAGRYLVRQLVKNQVTGCAVAFRRELLDVLLPFPGAVYAHDHWLSVVAPLVGGVIFLDEPLVEYRQHEANVTPKGGLPLLDRIRVRAKLAGLVAVAAIRAAARRQAPRPRKA